MFIEPEEELYVCEPDSEWKTDHGRSCEEDLWSVLVGDYLEVVPFFNGLFIFPLLLEDVAFLIFIDEVSAVELHEFMIESSTLLFTYDFHELGRFLQMLTLQKSLVFLLRMFASRTKLPPCWPFMKANLWFFFHLFFWGFSI